MSMTTTLARLVRIARSSCFGQLPRALRIDDADDRRMSSRSRTCSTGRRQLADRFLLLADDALALLHETDRHGIGDGGWPRAHRRPGCG